uniref:Lon protease homolog, mitochondrial 1 (Trinotate prediction) n=1 Tax=Henneguya salminicola TaxID=69463 RepID=A0A6G3MHU2_HENSL
MEETTNVHITLNNITDYAGYPHYHIRRPYDKGICGLVTGLSAIEGLSTGFTMDIECDFTQTTKKLSSNQILSTGLAGKSLSESSIIAFTIAKKIMSQIDPHNKIFDNNIVRIHFLEGGIKKDGPSAGVAIFCAVLSQALNIAVSRNLAMTGEITLKGHVMAVGGIREKITAVFNFFK